MLASVASEKLLLTLWVGGLWAIGYLAVPMAFVNLADVTVAGNYAGQLFSAINMLGLGCGVVLLVSKFVQYKTKVRQLWRFWVLLAMAIMSAAFIFYLQPQMAEIKQLDWRTDTQLSELFSLLHSISQNLYLGLSLLGLALVLSTDEQLQSIKAS